MLRRSRPGPRVTLALLWIALLVTAAPARGSLVVPMGDDDLVLHADAIVVGTVSRIVSHEDATGNIGSYITIDLDEVLKGPLAGREVTLRELGGSVGVHHAWVFANPDFQVGERVLLFLHQRADGTLRTYQFYLGKFTLITDPASNDLVAVREVPRRLTVLPAPSVPSGTIARSLDAVRTLIREKAVESPPPTLRPRPRRPFLSAVVPPTGPVESREDFRFLDDPDPPTPVNPDAVLLRWFEPDANVPIRMSINSLGEPSAPSQGFEQVRAALRAWSTVPTSSFRYAEGEMTTAGGFQADGVNAISFRDPNGDAMDPVNCRGVLAVGGISRAVGPITNFNGRRFFRALEADVVFNNGWEDCGYYENVSNFTEVATHELGHALGLGHSATAVFDPVLGRSGATMQPIAHFDGRVNRLHADDKAGLTFLYPGQTLTVRRTGIGTGTVVSSPPGISCGTDCVAGFAQNSAVALNGIPAPGSVFAGFVEPSCSGTFTMVAARTCTATFTIDPDLQMSALSGPAVAAPGETVQINNTVRNLGRPAAPFNVGFFLSSDSTITRDDTLLAMRRVNGLATNATSPALTHVLIPVDAVPGPYFLGVLADADNEVNEGLTEVNNAKALAITIAKPDLVVTALTVPATAGTGRTITVTSTVKNQAGVAVKAGPSTLAFYLSSDAVFDPADRRFLETRAIPALADNAVSTASTTLTIPADVVPGSYFVIAVADDLGDVAEADEGNNTRATAAALVIRRPDLSIASVMAPPASAPGRDISVRHVVRNLAALPASAPKSTSRFFLSNLPVLGVGDDLGTVSVPAITAGAEVAVTKVVRIPLTAIPGNYWIFVRANEDNFIPEATAGGNVGRTPAPIIVGPDLVVSAVTAAPVATAPGMPVSVTATVKNQGGQAAGAFDVSVYLSLNGNTYDDGVDALMATRRVAALGAGAAVNVALPFTLPAGAEAGGVSLIVRADSGGLAPNGEVTEAGENNNTRPVGVQIVRPDLAIQSVTAASATKPGMNLPVTTLVKNLAAVPGRAPATTLRLFLSPTATLDVTQATLLGEAPVASLAGMGAASVVKGVTIPLGTSPGRYWLLAQVNPDGVVQEAGDGSNNVGRTTAGVLVGSDLVVMTATATPAATAPGMPVSVTTTIKNQGGLAAGAFDVSLTLTTAADPIGQLLATRRVAGLAAQASAALAIPVSIPPLTPAGDAVVTVRADVGGAALPGEIEEADETNNARAVILPIVQPDLVVQSVTAPAASAPGGSIVLTTAVRNLATSPGRAPATLVRWFLSTDTTTTISSDTVLGEAPLASLAGLTMATVTKSVKIPSGLSPGRYWVKAKVNPDDLVQEADATNNLGLSALSILVGADLAVTGAVAPALTGRGATLAVTTTVKNLGGQAANSSTLSFFLAQDGKPDVPLAASRPVPSLAVGATSGPIATTIAIPIDAPFGDSVIRVQVDGGGAVTEGDETNNTRTTGRVVIAPPSLKVISIAPPIATIRGRLPGARLASVVVRNVGPGRAAPFDVAVYASPSSGTPGAGDVLFTRSVPGLATNASITLSGPAVVPESVAGVVRPIGDYFVSVIADPTNATGGSVSPDNQLTATATMSVLPDFGRLSNAAATITRAQCDDPTLNGTPLDLTGTFGVSTQTVSATQRSSTFTATMNLSDAGALMSQIYTISGRADAAGGQVTSSFTYRATSPGQPTFVGAGTIAAQLPLLNLDGTLTGHDTSADSCTFSGSLTITPGDAQGS